MDAQPTLDQLQVFVTVAEAGGFSAAARRLNRTQSVVSYTIANLEAQLDLRLFERAGTRQPRLTAAGEALLEDARRMAAGLQRLRARARGLRQGLEGSVAVAVDTLLPTAVLTASLAAFQQAYPTVGVRLHAGVMGAGVDLVVRRQVDLGIVGGNLAQHDALVGRRIGGHRIIPVAAPAHPLALASAPVPLAVIREHFQIVITDLTEHTRGQEFHVHAFNTWRVTDAATKRALILDGLGWGGLPASMVAADLAARRLVELDLEPYPPAEYELFAVHAADAPCGPAASWLADRFEFEMTRFTAGIPAPAAGAITGGAITGDSPGGR